MSPLQRQPGESSRNLTARSGWTDEELLLDYAQSGARESFEDLVHRYEPGIYRYLKSYLGSTELAEDAFQGTFLQLHLKCDQFKDDGRVRPWLYRIATNQAFDLMRRNHRHRAVSLDGWEWAHPSGGIRADESDPRRLLELQEDRDNLYQAAQRIPFHFRQVVFLVFCEELSYREAAEILGIPLGTVKSRLNAAVRKLQKILAPQITGVDRDTEERSYYSPLSVGVQEPETREPIQHSRQSRKTA